MIATPRFVGDPLGQQLYLHPVIVKRSACKYIDLKELYVHLFSNGDQHQTAKAQQDADQLYQ